MANSRVLDEARYEMTPYVYTLHGLGIQTDIDLNGVVEASAALAHVGHEPASRYYRAARARARS